jgi:hypothetical protein
MPAEPCSEACETRYHDTAPRSMSVRGWTEAQGFDRRRLTYVRVLARIYVWVLMIES